VKRANAKTPRRAPGDARLRAVSRALRRHAMSFPGATEDFPWGERVAKVNGKVFVFLGADPVAGGPLSFSVKLPESHADALDLPFARPTGYGLGKSGWVTASFGPGDEPPLEILRAWIAESYRAVAPRRLTAKTQAGRGKAPRPGRPPASRRGGS
jgi:predicted DNA-binding protein (MmcQ/YjbR family)